MKSRQQEINHNDGVYPYHLTQTCTRNIFLCGNTPAGFNREHRRRIIEKRMFFLHSVMAIDMIAYGILHNHYHLISLPNLQQAKAWSDYEVVKRWFCLHKPTTYPLIKQWFENPNKQNKTVHVKRTIRQWREQLTHISKMMAMLNQRIATQANAEDNMTGCSFWEKRYKAKRLETQNGLLQCMTYNDLNPIRAGIANTPEESKHTSLYQRIHQDISATNDVIEGIPEFNYDRLKEYNIALKPLMPLKGWENSHNDWGLPYELGDYQVLVDWTGRSIRPDKRGAIDNKLPPIAQRLALDKAGWIQAITQYDKIRHSCNIDRPYQVPT